MTRSGLKHCREMQDAREDLNGSVREGRIESRHSIQSLEGMGSRSLDLGAEWSVVDCQSGYSCHQKNNQVLGGCLCNQGQAAVQ